jgi:hypothetical protein
MGIVRCSEGVKQSLQHGVCGYGMLFNIRGILKMGEQSKALSMFEAESEKSYEIGRTPFWIKYCEGQRFPKTSWLTMT